MDTTTETNTTEITAEQIDDLAQFETFLKNEIEGI